VNPYYHYARFLHKQSRSEEALALVKKGMGISPNYSKFNELYNTLTLAGDYLNLKEAENNTCPVCPEYSTGVCITTASTR
jgi:hypothetical protein